LQKSSSSNDFGVVIIYLQFIFSGGEACSDWC